MTSSLYNHRQLAALSRLGDILIPHSEDFPAFSQVGCIDHIDAVMQPAKPQDIKDFGRLLSVLYYVPDFLLVGLIKLAVNANRMPEFVAPILRQLDIAIRGVVFTLYYANVVAEDYQGRQPYDAIDYHVHCAPDDKLADSA